MKRTTKHPARLLQVQQQLAGMLAELIIPELSHYPLVSITRVDLARDLKSGIVWVTAAPSVNHADLVATLTDRLPAWRKTLRSRLALRYFPNLTFRYDEGQADSLYIESLLEGK